jgi:alpha-tubulin suppressor-like RCC1 family protein
MKKFSRFASTCVLPLFLLLGGNALAADTDGDGLPNVAAPIQISAGRAHACALDSTGVHCWGNNSYGQTNVPALVNPVSVSAGLNFNCALDDNGVSCWGQNSDGQTTAGARTMTDKLPGNQHW